ncbi:unnamed protein product, partial [Ixodes pacificus]
MTILSIPSSLDRSMIVFMAGIRTSQPSNPNRFSDTHFFARNSSNLNKNQTRRTTRESSSLFRSLLSLMTPGDSNFSRIQLHWSRSLMNMYSTPMLPHRRRISLRGKTASSPPIKVVEGSLNSRSMSFSSA